LRRNKSLLYRFCATLRVRGAGLGLVQLTQDALHSLRYMRCSSVANSVLAAQIVTLLATATKCRRELMEAQMEWKLFMHPERIQQ
jgi:hypothetical protein